MNPHLVELYLSFFMWMFLTNLLVSLGVKFIFTNITLKNPKEEFSFTIRHENDTYTCKHSYSLVKC